MHKKYDKTAKFVSRLDHETDALYISSQVYRTLRGVAPAIEEQFIQQQLTTGITSNEHVIRPSLILEAVPTPNQNTPDFICTSFRF